MCPGSATRKRKAFFDFEGQNDLRAFVTLIRGTGDGGLRCGSDPGSTENCWNGGFPDWLFEKAFSSSEWKSGFMQEVESWYRIVAKQLDGLYFKDSGPILAIQLEKMRCFDDAEYLKKAERAGDKMWDGSAAFIR